MKRPKLSESAYLEIKRLIKDQVFKPGDPLPENVLSATLNMSRTPIREALHKLEDEEVVIIKPRLGAFVASVDFTQLCNLYETREAVEGMMANLCCKPHVPVEPFIRMRDELNQIMSIQEDKERELKMHAFGLKFISSLREFCDNPMLAKYSTSISALIENFSKVTHSIPLFPDESAPERMEVLEAIIAKNSKYAEEKARFHAQMCLYRIMNSATQHPKKNM
ncbi:MAG: GntR family transcriptional regulator [Sphaerochaeta sp.]|uniref:GntR family transcriptional regulator n=1 Tax=Sphaerochaeta sp. TaxID=1972642 RepID=UPI003D11DB4D